MRYKNLSQNLSDKICQFSQLLTENILINEYSFNNVESKHKDRPCTYKTIIIENIEIQCLINSGSKVSCISNKYNGLLKINPKLSTIPGLNVYSMVWKKQVKQRKNLM